MYTHYDNIQENNTSSIPFDSIALKRWENISMRLYGSKRHPRWSLVVVHVGIMLGMVIILALYYINWREKVSPPPHMAKCFLALLLIAPTGVSGLNCLRKAKTRVVLCEQVVATIGVLIILVIGACLLPPIISEQPRASHEIAFSVAVLWLCQWSLLLCPIRFRQSSQ